MAGAGVPAGAPAAQARGAFHGGPEELRPVVAQLGDRLVHVRERGVARFLGDAGRDLGRPAARQLLDRADVEVAVVEVALELRHPAREEAPVLADAVAAHRRAVRRRRAPRGTASVARSAAASSLRLASTRAARPLAPCVRVFHSSIAASVASGWRTAMTGPSAITARSASVTTVAISMIRSRSGTRPVISRSIQISRSSCAMLPLILPEARVPLARTPCIPSRSCSVLCSPPRSP